MTHIHFRELLPNEINSLYVALKNSATENNIGDRFIHTEEYLNQSLFIKKNCSSLVAELNGELIAYLLYSSLHNNFMLHAKPGVYMHALYVNQPHRRKKLATQLIEKLIDLQGRDNIGRIEFALLVNNQVGELFLKSLKFKEIDFAKQMRLIL
jgi:GNAT superfamily N-acetyltransferase